MRAVCLPLEKISPAVFFLCLPELILTLFCRCFGAIDLLLLGYTIRSLIVT